MAGMRGGNRQGPYLAALSKKLGAATSVVNVGFLAGARHPAASPGGIPLPAAMIAAIQQFGAPRAGIPARPFMSIMVAKFKPAWAKALAQTLKATDCDVPRSLALMGEQLKGEMQSTIVELFSPPLSPVTLMLRKLRKQNPDLVVTGRVVGEAAARVKRGESTSGVSTKPLVDTGFMLGSVDYEVKAGGK